MNSQSLMVIDPALEIPEIESYNGIAVRSPVNTSYHLPAIHSSKTMENQIENACGVILMGSAASVHDSLDWINDTKTIIQKAVDKKIPILGICKSISNSLFLVSTCKKKSFAKILRTKVVPGIIVMQQTLVRI